VYGPERTSEPRACRAAQKCSVEFGKRASLGELKKMDPVRRITLHWLQSAPEEISYQRASFRFSPHTWQPAINAYRCETGMRICVDLAGVDRAAIDLTVEPYRVVIRGNRDVPEPTDREGRPVQMLAMEIDYGPFERTVDFPEEVNVKKAHAEQRNGLLWIHLPFNS